MWNLTRKVFFPTPSDKIMYWEKTHKKEQVIYPEVQTVDVKGEGKVGILNLQYLSKNQVF